MSATNLIDGRTLAAEIYKTFPERLARLDFVPTLVDVVVGDDPVALSYVGIKGRKAKNNGLGFEMAALPESATLDEVRGVIESYQGRPEVSGVIVQLPVPEHLDQAAVLEALNPALDVDCIGPINNRLFYSTESAVGWLPPTAAAVWEILESLNIDLKKQQIAVVGQGELVGRPITYLLERAGCGVLTADKSTADLASVTQNADIVISAVGKANLITGDLLKPGAIVIDAGTSESGGGIVGDVDRDSVEGVAGWLSPVPGGVGPVTVAKLLENVLTAAEQRSQESGV